MRPGGDQPNQRRRIEIDNRHSADISGRHRPFGGCNDIDPLPVTCTLSVVKQPNASRAENNGFEVPWA